MVEPTHPVQAPIKSLNLEGSVPAPGIQRHHRHETSKACASRQQKSLLRFPFSQSQALLKTKSENIVTHFVKTNNRDHACREWRLYYEPTL
jgi:hypothetical protein